MTTDVPQGGDPAIRGAGAFCDVCDKRRARWRAAGPGADFFLCDVCREAEPCGRCGIERDECACAEGPDVHVWLPIAGEG